MPPKQKKAKPENTEQTKKSTKTGTTEGKVNKKKANQTEKSTNSEITEKKVNKKKTNQTDNNETNQKLKTGTTEVKGNKKKANQSEKSTNSGNTEGKGSKKKTNQTDNKETNQKQKTAKKTFYDISETFDKNDQESVADLIIKAYNGELQMSEEQKNSLQFLRLSDFLEEFKKHETQPISEDIQIKDIISLIILHLFKRDYNLKDDSKRALGFIERDLLKEFKKLYQNEPLHDNLLIQHYYVYKYFELLKQYYKDNQQITNFLAKLPNLSIAECTLFLNIIIQTPLNLQIEEDYQKNEYLIFYCSQFT